MKRCSTCQQDKPETEYDRRSASKDGLQHACRPCRSKAYSDWQRANMQREVERVRAWRRSKVKQEAAPVRDKVLGRALPVHLEAQVEELIRAKKERTDLD